ncbi:hypothetical protein EG328_007534 [Venturia inaequalis]|uniref:Uncharacterized protein n=1 Tax=Venturia inaequalis TaxID=5025 RepID=A0A8H3UFG5_VENIN|nr:hypothetical protein EG328_007534 [Venturia inaequalis]
MAKGNDEVAIARRETYDTRVKHRGQRGNLPKSLRTKNIDKRFDKRTSKTANAIISAATTLQVVRPRDSSDAVYWAQAKDLA